MVYLKLAKRIQLKNPHHSKQTEKNKTKQNRTMCGDKGPASICPLMGFAGVAQGFGVARTPLSRAWEEPEKDGVGYYSQVCGSEATLFFV